MCSTSSYAAAYQIFEQTLVPKRLKAESKIVFVSRKIQKITYRQVMIARIDEHILTRLDLSQFLSKALLSR
jgi:uncharacterized protein YgbK (DUF1537 family)